MASLVILMAANGCFTNKLFQRLKIQALVSEELFQKKEVCLISRFLFASYEVNMPYVT